MRAAGPDTLAFAIRGPIKREDLPGLCDRVCALLNEHHPRAVVCDVRTVQPDAVTVDALARLQLAARRHTCRVYFQHASAELVQLVDFMGMTEICPRDLHSSAG